MSTPIHFQGTDYDSVEAMPPGIRAAYEQARPDQTRNKRSRDEDPNDENDDEDDDEGEGDDEDDDDEAPEKLPAPAWGGARAKGSVPVPAGFEQVIELGPALAVLDHQGLQLPSLGAPRAHVLVRYRDGFACQTGGKDVHTWRWEDVAVIQSNKWYSEHGYENIEYTLTKHSGEQLILDNRLKELGDLGHIKKAVFALLKPPLAQRYQAGEALAFGPVTIQRQNGLQLEGKLYAWDAIQDIRLDRGRVKLTLKNGKHHEVRASALPNIELFGQLIGLDISFADLGYY